MRFLKHIIISLIFTNCITNGSLENKDSFELGTYNSEVKKLFYSEDYQMPISLDLQYKITFDNNGTFIQYLTGNVWYGTTKTVENRIYNGTWEYTDNKLCLDYDNSGMLCNDIKEVNSNNFKLKIENQHLIGAGIDWMLFNKE